MRRVTINDIKYLALMAREDLERSAYGAGHENVKIYLHWTAGWYDQLYDDYHILITGSDDAGDDADGAIFVSTENFDEILQHTWLRNTGSISVALCCCAGANTNDLGEAPPTQEQIEQMARVVAALAYSLGLDIDKTTVLTHGEAADNEDNDEESYGQADCYGPLSDCERWDLEYLGTDESPAYNPYAADGTRGGDVIRGKANFYLKQGI